MTPKPQAPGAGRLAPDTRDSAATSRRRKLTDHHTLGFAYLGLSTVALLAGTALSLLMRLHLAWPAWQLPLHGLVLPEEYLGLVTLHGTLMLFFVLTIAPQWGFGNLLVPAQIGASSMAFPRLNLAACALFAAALLTLLVSPFIPGGSAISGWTAYPPLSAIPSAGPGQAGGMDLWLVSIALFALASLVAAVNMLATIITMRCAGMAWHRVPLTVWGWFTAALLSIPAFAVLLAALAMLFCDRHLGTSFFLPAVQVVNGMVLHHPGDGSPLLWLHLFWFFGHPEVYIAILPGIGLTSMVLANFARRRVFAYRIMIAVTLLIGLLGILVWGHHMFVAGLSPFAGSTFAISTMAIALPASAEVLSWIATVWGSRPRPGVPFLTTPMLFALGFVSLFIAGGLTGPILAQPVLDQYLHNTMFVVAHFHLIMAMAGVFGLYLATYYWFPLLAGRLLNERLGRTHFYATLLGAYATFLPMHLAGLAGEPRHYAQLTGVAGPTGVLLKNLLPLQRHITYAALFLAVAQLPFFWNLFRTLRGPRNAGENPWGATTMEWAPALVQPDKANSSDFNAPRVYVAPCEYSLDGATFHPQWQPLTKPTSEE